MVACRREQDPPCTECASKLAAAELRYAEAIRAEREQRIKDGLLPPPIEQQLQAERNRVLDEVLAIIDEAASTDRDEYTVGGPDKHSTRRTIRARVVALRGDAK